LASFTYGDRIAALGSVLLGCSVVVMDTDRANLLLTRRTDNGRWCLPGGHLDAGESVTECAIRETKEETGLDVDVVRLVGVYSNPHRLLSYADGNRFHIIALNFEARVTGGELTLSDETTEFCWCDPGDVGKLDVMEHHLERIEDAFTDAIAPFVR
jgi:ADP-ribose pyrophosphatase YjhB (NUDIX family)